MIQPVNNNFTQGYFAQGYPVQQPTYTMTPAYVQMPPQMQQPAQNNAVKIDIINPQAGGAQPAYNPYMMPQYSPYAMPAASAYAPQVPAQTVPMMPTYYQPQQQAPVILPPPLVTTEQQINNAPQATMVQTPVPQPVAMPQPPVATPVDVAPVQVPVQTVEPVVVQQAPVEAPVATPETAAPVAAPQIEEATATPGSVDLNKILEKLNSTNLEDQLLAIENIAETANSNPQEATKLLDTQIMDALGNIINKDTTQLPAPTKEQIELRQKLIAGETLTPEQTEEANKISELEIAERNKQYALYTVAILQKLLSTEVEKAQGVKIGMQDLPMINDVVNVAKSNPNPMLRASALAALSYIATPENKQLLTTMFEQSQKDEDPNVQAVATEALSKLSQI